MRLTEVENSKATRGLWPQRGPMDMSFIKPFMVDATQVPLDSGDAEVFGTVKWRTLICGDVTPAAGTVMGIAEFDAGGTLRPHRHEPSEIYFGLSGSGTVTIDGIPHEIRQGVTILIPENALHGTVAGPEGLSFLYTFPKDRFSDVEYRFAENNIE